MNEQPNWRKSTFSGAQGDCVELAGVAGGISVRDSKDPAGPALHFTRSEMLAFLEGAKAGEFDDMVS